jgi:hypothetical protein
MFSFYNFTSSNSLIGWTRISAVTTFTTAMILCLAGSASADDDDDSCRPLLQGAVRKGHSLESRSSARHNVLLRDFADACRHAAPA